MATAAEDFQTFRRYTAARVAYLEQTTSMEFHDRYWILRSSRSLADFEREFPAAADRQAALKRVRELNRLQRETMTLLRESLDRFA